MEVKEMDQDTFSCKACDGTGLQADDEFWKYTCSVCGGNGFLMAGESLEPKTPFEVDETNRTLE
jgi:DnaJ-class molecular chaperone